MRLSHSTIQLQASENQMAARKRKDAKAQSEFGDAGAHVPSRSAANSNGILASTFWSSGPLRLGTATLEAEVETQFAARGIDNRR
jgi:hypothetical protein